MRIAVSSGPHRDTASEQSCKVVSCTCRGIGQQSDLTLCGRTCILALPAGLTCFSPALAGLHLQLCSKSSAPVARPGVNYSKPRNTVTAESCATCAQKLLPAL